MEGRAGVEAWTDEEARNSYRKRDTAKRECVCERRERGHELEICRKRRTTPNGNAQSASESAEAPRKFEISFGAEI